MEYNRFRVGRNVSGMDGFIPAGTKFDTIPMLRAGEMVRMDADDLYVMRGLLCGEAISYTKHIGKLSLGDAIATAKASTDLLRRLSIYEGTVRPSHGDCLRLPVMSGYSLLSDSPFELGEIGGKFYRKYHGVMTKLGAMGFPEVQKLDLEAMWALKQAQLYCADPKDAARLQHMIPKECQPAVDILEKLRTCDSSEGITFSHRVSALMAMSKISDRGRFGCEMALRQLTRENPGKSARVLNVIWTGLPSNRVRTLPNAFIGAWAQSTPSSQARSIASILPGVDVCIPVGCLRYTHSAFGNRYYSEFQFYDSDILRDWARTAYSEAIEACSMDKLDVVLPMTIKGDELIPASFSEKEYDIMCQRRYMSAKNAMTQAARDVQDLNLAAASLKSSNQNMSEGQSL